MNSHPGGIMIAGKENVERANFARLYFAAKIEATTGLRHSSGRSALANLKQNLGVRVRDKLAAIRECRAILTERGVLSGEDRCP